MAYYRNQLIILFLHVVWIIGNNGDHICVDIGLELDRWYKNM